MKTPILFVALLASATFAKPQPGLPFLLIWPDARSTALAGAMTGLADGPDAAFFNPAGLAFQSGVGAIADYGQWLPEVYPGMWQGYFAGRLAFPMSVSKHVAFGIDAAELNLSDLGISYVYPDWPPPRIQVWRAYAGAALALRPMNAFGVGLKLKYIRTNLPCYGEAYGRLPEFGTREGGTGNTWACDVGTLWQPSAVLSAGLSLANLGPCIDYTEGNPHDQSPTVLRLGACWTPLEQQASSEGAPELDWLLAGAFYDSTNAVPFSQKLQKELYDVWKTLAVEVTALRLVTLRLAYFEDRGGQRGGLVYGEDFSTYRYSLCDLLARHHLGQFRSVSLCWGFGIGYKDYFRLDVSSDAAIYDFPTSNWKFSLVANDLVGGIRELSQGRDSWEE